MHRIYLYIIVFCSLPFVVTAQNSCYHDDLLQAHLLHHIEAEWALTQLLNNPVQIKSNSIYEIPVVFHIIHNGDAIGENENLSVQVINDQLNSLNKDFSALNEDSIDIPASFLPFFGNAQISFCLAKTDPFGNPTTGIIRHEYLANGFDIDSIQDFIQPQTIWDRDFYLNVWVCNFAGNLAQDDILGFAQPPIPTFGDTTDGVVIRYDMITLGGRTLVHEIGHFLGLMHTWGDDNGLCSTDVGGGDDGISDTPDQASPYYNCPLGSPSTCGSLDMFMNYMDYTSDDCSLLFTPEQVNRMHQTLQGFRNTLANNNLCRYEKDLIISKVIAPEGSICQTTFYPLIEVQNIGLTPIQNYTIEWQVDNVLIETIAINETLPPDSTTLIQWPAHEIGFGMDKTSQFQITQVDGTNEYQFNNDVITIFNTVFTGNGNPLNILHTFSGTSISSGLTVENPDNGVTWELHNQLVKCAVIDNQVNEIGEIDRIRSNDINISSEQPYISFDYYYRAEDQNSSDELEVSLSQDCGVNWLPLWQKSGLDLSNGLVDTSGIIPDSSDFTRIIIPLQDYNSLQKARFRFTNVSGNGNPIYLDNIFVIDSTITNIRSIEPIIADVYPNPTKGVINISLQEKKTYHFIIRNQLGQLVHGEWANTNQHMVVLNHYQSGIYWLEISDENGNKTIKKTILY